MRILLIHPQATVHRHTTGIYGRSARYAPITMPTLAALVPPDLHAEVRAVDEMVERLDLDQPADLVGITCITGTATRAYEIADHFRAAGKTVVIGGIHATLLPDEAARHADAVVTGYAEDTWPGLLRDYASGSLNSRYAHSPGAMRYIRPRRSLIHRSRYAAPNTVEFIRGCSKACEFCVSGTMTARPVPRDIPDAIAEVRSLPGKTVSFLDPNLISDIDVAREFFGQLRDLKKWWFGCATVEIGDHPDVLDLMARSGCKGLLIGFDSLNQDALDAAQKPFNRVPDFLRVATLLHAHGIMITGCFMVGFDADGPEVFARTADFAQQARIDIVHYTIYTPYPGTVAHERLEIEGRILTKDWSLYDGRHVVFRPARMTPRALQDGFDRMWTHTYSAAGMGQRLRGRPYLLKPAALAANMDIRRFRRRAAEVFP